MLLKSKIQTTPSGWVPALGALAFDAVGGGGGVAYLSQVVLGLDRDLFM